jgi:hypothetical protein
VRGIRVRYGDANDDDAMSINNANNVIVDHCSVSWGVDETLHSYHMIPGGNGAGFFGRI